MIRSLVTTGATPPNPRAGLFIAACALFVASCIEVPPPPAKGALDVKDVKVSDGVALETACTPTGVEICFDAKDNNCNGVIDEGCGIHTGILQFAIAWDQPDTDVDLHVYDHTGDLAETGKVTAGGLQQDKDCPGSNNACHDQNIENVFLAEGDPHHGKYKVIVHLEKVGPTSQPPVKVRLSARIGQRSFSMVMELSPGPQTEDKTFEFTL